MIAGFMQHIRDVETIIAVFSGLLAIVSGVITIYLFREEQKKKRKKAGKKVVKKGISFKLSVMIAVVIVSVAVTTCIIVFSSGSDQGLKASPALSGVLESLEIVKSPVSDPDPGSKRKNKIILELVLDARTLSGSSITEALSKFKQAYELLPEKQKRKTFTDSIGGYMDFRTQIGYYNNYFKTLNY